MVDLTSCALKMPPGLSSVPTNAYWQSKLESAQNVLFCKELFSQVAHRDCGMESHFSLILDRSCPEYCVTKQVKQQQEALEGLVYAHMM